MNFLKNILPSAKLKFIFIPSISLVLFTTGCLPKEVPLTQPSKTPVGYAEFNGITAAETVNGSRVTVRWNPSSDPNVVAYNIYDSTFKFQPKLIRTVSAPADRVTLSGLSNQSLYSFRVRAANADNKEDENTVDIQAIPYAGISNVEVISSEKARITFPDGSNSDQINIYCRLSTATQWELQASVRNTSLTQVLIEDLQPGLEYTCRAAIEIDGFVDNNPTTVTFTPMGQAHSIVFTTQPGNAPAGSALSVQPVITIRDANGNVVAGGPDSNAMITLTIANSSPTTGTIRGTYNVEAIAGIATFPDIFLEESGQKIITASKADTSSVFFGTSEMQVNSNLFTITPGAVSADHSTISISPAPPEPPRVANGMDSYSVTVVLRDQYGNAVSGVRPTIVSNITGDTIAQPTQNTNASGETTGSISSTIADFVPNLRSLSIGSPAGLSTVNVAALFIPGPATRLAYSVQPMNSPAGEMALNNIQVQIQDAQGNRIRTGPSATAEVSLSIAANVNGAILTGTNPKTATDGVVSFGDLGIDRTGTGYRLVASSGVLTPAFSNTFNITAGIPRQISISGPPNVLSGACSSAITVQLQDLGGNPANAIQSTPVTLSGFGDGSFYTSNTCGGAAIGTSLTFTAGTNTRAIYYRGNRAEALTINISDTSSVMNSGQHEMTVSPNKIGMIAQAAAPAAPGTPLSVVAGQCSTEIVLTPMGNNNNPGPTFIPTTVAITGLMGSEAQLFSDPSCTMLLNPSSIVLPINSGPDYTYKAYLKDPKAESLMISVSDPDGHLTTTTGPQSVIVLPSNLHFTGPTSVVAGQCSAAFTIQMRDTQGNPAAAIANRTLNINGIPVTSSGRFFTSPACSGGGTRTTLTFPEGNTSIQVYFRSVSSDSLSISISDSLSQMTQSQTINLTVSPSALRIVTPVIGQSDTNICAGPFYIDTLDALGNLTNAVNTIHVNLAGLGTSTSFYSNSNCTTSITQVSFTTGQNRKTVYLMGYYPETSLSLTATDTASILSQGTATWSILGAKGWIGTSIEEVDFSSPSIPWFRANVTAAAARSDGVFSSYKLAMSPDRRYLYSVEAERGRITKYDYQDQKYIGWIGRFVSGWGLPVTGSNLATPSIAACVNHTSDTALPGWCVGGESANDGNISLGRLHTPYDLEDDGQYIYVLNYYNGISRFHANTGAFDGWIGLISSNSGLAPATGGPPTCSTVLAGEPTPGWCLGGTTNTGDPGTNTVGDGRFRYPRGFAIDTDYIYVANTSNITRYHKTTGAFAGWVGMVSSMPGSGEVGCNTVPADQMTPGWCYGGAAKAVNPVNHLGNFGGLNHPRDIFIHNDSLYVLHENAAIVEYDKTTGATLRLVRNTLTGASWYNAAVNDVDNKIYIADYSGRILRLDFNGLIEGWVGKVLNNTGMSGNPGCSTLAINDNTPGWCIGGAARQGLDEGAFLTASAIVLDGSGRIIVGEHEGSGRIRRFDLGTGVYADTLTLADTSPSRWTNDASTLVARHGYGQNSMYNPRALHIKGENLYVAEATGSRVKKINRRTGELLGWVGAVTTRPTAGVAGCIGSNANTASPGWCLGALFRPSFLAPTTSLVNPTTEGILHTPQSLTSDDTYIYVVDAVYHRINRFRIDNGAPEGWIGRIQSSPGGGAAGCSGASTDSFTPGWCTGGTGKAGNGDGHLNNPGDIVHHAGTLYVADTGNHRIASYNAASGAFTGWIGRISAAPSGGCTTANNGNYVVSTGGWCMGGTAQAAIAADRGGGFYFWNSGPNRASITTDGVHLYISNFYARRIDKYNFNGNYLGSVPVNTSLYTTTDWSNNPVAVAAMTGVGGGHPLQIWADSTHIYGTQYRPTGQSAVVWKMNKASGEMLGWQGAINPAQVPTGGDPGCAGASGVTPGWCKFGQSAPGFTLGGLSDDQPNGLSGDDNFIYVSDHRGNRVYRFPK